MKKILFIFGTRPEAIKLFPLILESKKNLVSDIKLFCTGQHDKALEEIYEIFNTYPDLTLNLKRKNNSLSELSSLLLDNTNKAINKYKPDLVVVHGDTSSSFIGALNAFYNKIDIAHIEAGLRTGDVYSPFPEEINRSFISKIASYNFCPTNISKKNRELLEEKTYIPYLNLLNHQVSKKDGTEKFLFKLEDVAAQNIEKLHSRLDRGKLGGSGDNR